MDGKVTSNSRCGKWHFSRSSSRKCWREIFSLHSSWRAKRVCSFRYGKHFRTAELGSGSLKGRGVSMFYCYPKSVFNLSSICRASFWWGAIQLAIGHESRFKDYSSLCVSLSCLWLSTCHLDFDAISYLPDPCAHGMPIPEAKEYRTLYLLSTSTDFVSTPV
jgi:hypothetical protein